MIELVRIEAQRLRGSGLAAKPRATLRRSARPNLRKDLMAFCRVRCLCARAPLREFNIGPFGPDRWQN